MIKAALFDFYGVLHTDTLWGLANLYIPDRTDEQTQRLADMARASNLGYIDRDEFWRTAAEIYGRELDEVIKDRDEMGELDPGLLRIVKTIRDSGVKTAIISNVGKGFLSQKMSVETMDRYFDAVIESGEIGSIKPDREIFEYACKKLEVAPNECVFFDDAPRNVDGARKIGMHAEVYTDLPSCKAVLTEMSLL